MIVHSIFTHTQKFFQLPFQSFLSLSLSLSLPVSIFFIFSWDAKTPLRRSRGDPNPPQPTRKVQPNVTATADVDVCDKPPLSLSLFLSLSPGTFSHFPFPTRIRSPLRQSRCGMRWRHARKRRITHRQASGGAGAAFAKPFRHDVTCDVNMLPELARNIRVEGQKEKEKEDEMTFKGEQNFSFVCLTFLFF